MLLILLGVRKIDLWDWYSLIRILDFRVEVVALGNQNYLCIALITSHVLIIVLSCYLIFCKKLDKELDLFHAAII